MEAMHLGCMYLWDANTYVAHWLYATAHSFSYITDNCCTISLVCQMHDLSSRHLAKFIGVAIDTNIIYTVHEEYSMGSLYQLLHDPTKKLDTSFQHSFALDIIKVCGSVHSICVYICLCVCVLMRVTATLF